MNEISMVGPSFIAKLFGESWMIDSDSGALYITDKTHGRNLLPLDCDSTSLLPRLTGYRLSFVCGDKKISIDSVPSRTAHHLRNVINSARLEKYKSVKSALDDEINSSWSTFCEVSGIAGNTYIQKRIFSEKVPSYLDTQKARFDDTKNICEKELQMKTLPRGANRLDRLFTDSESFRKNINEKRLAAQVVNCTPLFIKAGLNLTDEQARSALAMERANLLEAGAGSGKTIVLVARALYAVHEGIAKPSEILCLAYNRSAVDEIRTRLIKAFSLADVHGAEAIQVKTFHSFGLALISAGVSGARPVVVTPETSAQDSPAHDAFSSALSQTLKSTAHGKLYKTLLTETLENDWRVKSASDIASRKEQASALLHANLMRAESAYHCSRQKAQRFSADRDLMTFGRVWGLTEQRCKKLQGYTAFVDHLSAKFRELMTVYGLSDFADMTVQAASLLYDVAQGHLPDIQDDPIFKLKFLMVDEFQDISFDRAQLVRQLAALNPDSIMFGVGDDWQAINRFSGSDLSIFTEFESFFGDTDRRQLTATFRSCRGIAETARQFVIENPTQSKKKINRVIDERTQNSILFMDYSSDKEVEFKIGATISGWIKSEASHVPSVMILDRNGLRKSKVLNEKMLKRIQRKFQTKAKISFNTAHGSKGLEADYVIVTGLIEGVFPSTLNKEFWHDLFMPREELEIDFADERRLFYVAVNRAKKCVALLSPKHKPSPFVAEFKKLFKLTKAECS